MIQCKTLCAVPVEDAFAAFSAGYSDYLLPVHITREQFEERFFGPEGNDPALSFIAYEGNKPVGLILGGIRVMDGIRTMRCGTFCTAPDSRGTGTGRQLFALHRAAAEEAGCKQMFLEVLTQNARAIRFYEASGYRTGYTLKYYTYKGAFPRPDGDAPFTVRELPVSAWQACRASLQDVHINWQNEPVCFAEGVLGKPLVLGAEAEGKIAAVIAVLPQGKVCFLWVDREYRIQGLGRWLLYSAAEALRAEKLTISLPNNAVLEGFLRKSGFEKDPIEQYEMYLPL